MNEIKTSIDNQYDYNIWYKTKDPNFIDINRNSRIPDKWLNYSSIRRSDYSDSFIKPINPYVLALVPPPKLIGINNNIVRLRQGNHAEFFLLKEKNGMLKHIDRPWMRQYYNTNLLLNNSEDCFNETFKFYVPWYVDDNIEIKYEKPNVESPFVIDEIVVKHKKIDIDNNYIEPDFIPFKFKNKGSHMEDLDFGKIKRQSPMFDIIFEASGIMLQRVKEFYEKN